MNYNKKKIIKELLKDTNKELTDEEFINELLSTSITEETSKKTKETFGQKAV